MSTKTYFSTRVREGIKFLICSLVVIAGVNIFRPALAQEAPVSTNLPITLTADVDLGATNVTLPVVIDGVERFSAEVIVPVEGATFTLLDPAGSVVFAPGAPEVEFTPGVELQPGSGLPGGVFVTPAIESPVDGDWLMRLDFPAATDRTVVVATVFSVTNLQTGIALARDTVLVGEEAPVGLIVLNGGLPVTGLTPDLSISLEGGSGSTVALDALDNGAGLDGLSDDGVYTGIFTAMAAGIYTVVGRVKIPQPGGGEVERVAFGRLTVVNSPLEIVEVGSSPIFGSGGCIEEVEVQVDVNVFQQREYIVSATLRSTSGHSVKRRARQVLPVGDQSVVIAFPRDSIEEELVENGPYSVEIDILEFSNGTLDLAAPILADTDPIILDLDDLCSDAIELEANLTVEPILQGGFISALEFSFPVNITTAGTYQVSVKVVGSEGEDIELVGFFDQFNAGSNTASFSLPANRFLGADGPYRAISLLVVRGGVTAQLGFLGQSPAYQRWQFLPEITGDLDNDGDIDADDRSIVLAARNEATLSPGDRRDINGDDRIDIRDARSIVNLACEAGSCP